MKIALISLLLSVISVKSCEKKNVSGCSCQLPGIWSGTYSVDQLISQGELPYTFIFKPDGTLLTEGKGGDDITYYSAGIWELNGSDLNCRYTTINFPYGDVVQSASFRFSVDNCELKNGKWKDLEIGANSGSYKLVQVK